MAELGAIKRDASTNLNIWRTDNLLYQHSMIVVKSRAILLGGWLVVCLSVHQSVYSIRGVTVSSSLSRLAANRASSYMWRSEERVLVCVTLILEGVAHTVHEGGHRRERAASRRGYEPPEPSVCVHARLQLVGFTTATYASDMGGVTSESRTSASRSTHRAACTASRRWL